MPLRLSAQVLAPGAFPFRFHGHFIILDFEPAAGDPAVHIPSGGVRAPPKVHHVSVLRARLLRGLHPCEAIA
jgi:hypothetical protein